MNKKGFTLIELLTILVLLSVIASFVGMSISKSIENSKKQTLIINVEKIIKAVTTYKTNYELENGKELLNLTIPIVNREINNLDLGIDGVLPEDGEITISDDGNLSIYAYDNGYCAVKNENSEDFIVKKVDKLNCNCDLTE